MYNYAEMKIGISVNPDYHREDKFKEAINMLLTECGSNINYLKDNGQIAESIDFTSLLIDEFSWKENDFNKLFQDKVELGKEFLLWFISYAMSRTAYSGSSNYSPVMIELNPLAFPNMSGALNVPKGTPYNDICEMEKEDVKRLDQLGIFWDSDDMCFKSFKYGSA